MFGQIAYAVSPLFFFIFLSCEPEKNSALNYSISPDFDCDEPLKSRRGVVDKETPVTRYEKELAKHNREIRGEQRELTKQRKDFANHKSKIADEQKILANSLTQFNSYIASVPTKGQGDHLLGDIRATGKNVNNGISNTYNIINNIRRIKNMISALENFATDSFIYATPGISVETSTSKQARQLKIKLEDKVRESESALSQQKRETMATQKRCAELAKSAGKRFKSQQHAAIVEKNILTLCENIRAAADSMGMLKLKLETAKTHIEFSEKKIEITKGRIDILNKRCQS